MTSNLLYGETSDNEESKKNISDDKKIKTMQKNDMSKINIMDQDIWYIKKWDLTLYFICFFYNSFFQILFLIKIFHIINIFMREI